MSTDAQICLEQEILLLKTFYGLLKNEKYLDASQYFHSTCVVLQNNEKLVFDSSEKRIDWLKQYSETLNRDLEGNYLFSLTSSKTLSEKLRFSQLKLKGRAKRNGVKKDIEALFTLSSDEHGNAKIMVIVLDDF